MRFARIVKLWKIITKATLLGLSGNTLGVHRAINDGFRDLGGVYVKFLQLLVLKTEFLKSSDPDEKYSIFDRVEVDDVDIHKFLSEQLPPEKLARIQIMNTEPLAAGSFAQIYQARIDNQFDAIVKIQRPELSKYLNFDLKMLRIFVTFAQFFNPKSMAGVAEGDIKTVFKDFKNSTIQETDYLEEIDFANQQFNNYRDNPRLFIPYTFNELCTNVLIVQERLHGVQLTDIMLMKNKGYDVEKYVAETLNSNLADQLELAGFEYLYGIFTMGRIQGDPHPGNIFLLPDNKIGIIDFGISAYAPKDLGGFLDLLRGMQELYDGNVDMGSFVMKSMRFFSRDLYNSIIAVSRYQLSDNNSETTIENALRKAANQAYESNKGHVNLNQLIDQGQVFRLVNNTINQGNRFALELDVDGSLVVKAANMYMMVLHSLGMKKQIMRNVFARTIAAVEANPDIDIKPAPQPDIASAIETITAWLEKIAERDSLLYRRITRGASKV